jgi:uncharacterized protein (TIRG00374 family)
VNAWPAARFRTLEQRVALAASIWVGASLGIAGLVFWQQTAQVGGLASFSVPLLLVALGFGATSFGLRALRWHFFLNAAGAHPSFPTSLRTQLVGFSLTMTPGKVGELYKCHLIEQHTAVPAARTAPIVLFEKVLDATAFAGLAIATAAVLPGMADSVHVAARTLVVLGVVAAATGALIRSLRSVVAGDLLTRVWGESRVGRWLASSIVQSLRGTSDLLHGGLIARNAALSFAARTCDGLALASAAWAIGINLPALAGILVLNSSGTLGGISMLPGGIGVVEGSMSVLLNGFGAGPAAAIAGTLAARIVTFWLWVGIGLYLLIRSGRAGESER